MKDLTSHQCYIQPEEEEGLEPTLFVYADIEAMDLPDGSFQPNLVLVLDECEAVSVNLASWRLVFDV